MLACRMLHSSAMRALYLRSAVTALVALGVAFGCSGRTVQAPVDPRTAKACTTDADCGLGEIDHEIYSRSDCLCLFGCAFLPLSKKTIERRQSEYDASCDPRLDAHGNPCPIDDCAVPPQPACMAGQCAFSQDSGR